MQISAGTPMVSLERYKTMTDDNTAPTWFGSAWRLLVSLAATSAILFNTCPAGAQGKIAARPGQIEDQRILHVLNRLGFGARPGDVERVKAMGLDNYLEQQLNPGKINDTVVEAKLSTLPTLSMTTAELYEKYPQPGRLLRQLERRGELPADLAPSSPDKAPKTRAPDQPLASAPPDNAEYRRLIREYYQQNGLQLPQRIIGELQASRILRAVYSERQLQEVMVDFWTNHFNVFAGKGADRWLLVAYDRDTIRPHVLGKFSALLQATAESPAMLFYLDNFQSVSPNAQLGEGSARRQGGGPLAQLLLDSRGNNQPQLRMSNNPDEQRPQQQRPRGINENYARELMELHTLGVTGGYTQRDVQEVARCFTGWTILAPRGGGVATQRLSAGPRAEMLRAQAGRFFFNPRAHDDGEKIVLGHKIAAGGGIKDGLQVLDILAHHPATAKFLAAKLARHFVSDSPSPAFVDRIAATFTKTDGDIRETLRAIFVSPEFNSPAAYRAKVKRPFELAISAVRALGAETNGGPQLHQWIARMGEPLYGLQTPNGYSDTAESWVNSGGLLERLNFGLMLAGNHIPGTRVDLKQLVGSDAEQATLNKTQILDRFVTIIVGTELTSKTKQALLKQLTEQNALVVPAQTAAPLRVADDGGEMGEQMPRGQAVLGRRQLARADTNITDPVARMVGLILGSPEFQRQ
jgi:uncharacterized protein (DUF1800 family)